MMSRRQMLMMLTGDTPAEKVGIFTKGYEAVLTPEGANSFTIQHNLGVMPRLCIVEAIRDTITATNYAINLIMDFDVYGSNADKTIFDQYLYHYNDADRMYGNFLTSSDVTYDEYSITLKAPYTYSRSPWDTSADYIVHVWG